MRQFILCSILMLAILPASAIDVPAGYVLQELNPTGGEIARPKDWFYTEHHHGPVFVWTISKEDASKGPYQTGFRIQTFVGIRGGTGKSPKEFCLHFLDEKQKLASKIVSTFPEMNQGMFTRQGIEVIEPITQGKTTQDYHIIYSVFWGNDTDLGVITIEGTPDALWSQYAETFKVMSAFQLYDMQKIQETQKIAPAPNGK
jgi:hypothetical protein